MAASRGSKCIAFDRVPFSCLAAHQVSLAPLTRCISVSCTAHQVSLAPLTRCIMHAAAGTTPGLRCTTVRTLAEWRCPEEVSQEQRGPYTCWAYSRARGGVGVREHQPLSRRRYGPHPPFLDWLGFDEGIPWCSRVTPEEVPGAIVPAASQPRRLPRAVCCAGSFGPCRSWSTVGPTRPHQVSPFG